MVYRVKPAVPFQQMFRWNLRGWNGVTRKRTQARRHRWPDSRAILEELKDNLVDAKSSSSGSDRGYLPKQHRPDRFLCFRSSGKHNILTHFPKDPNCEICRRTKITRAPRKRRVNNDIPRAPKFGDIITADPKVLSEEGESRNNHRYAIVVPDLAIQLKATYAKQDLHKKRLRKFPDPEENPKVIHTDNSLEFSIACENTQWNTSASTPHRAEMNCIAENAARRVQEGT